MCQRVPHQIFNVPVDEGIVNMLSLTASFHYIFRTQNPEPLRNRRHRLALSLGEFADTATPTNEAAQQA